MGTYTENLQLYKADPVADGNDTFNIDTMMNDNWDKIDKGIEALEEAMENAGGVKTVNEISPDDNGNVALTAADVGALPITGGTLTGNLVQKNLTIDDGLNTVTVIKVYDDGDTEHNYGSEVIIGGNGNLYIGSGESPANLYKENGSSTTENLYLTSDNVINIVVNCNTIANRKTITISAAGAIVVPNNTDYATAKVRNIKASTTDLTAGTSALSNGDIYIVYE